jgi:hypothetical protein
MTTTTGGMQVRSGYYWNMGKWEVTPVARDGEKLPGGRADKFLRIPLIAVFAIVPIMGGLFVVFLPFIGFALAIYAAVKPLVALFQKSAQDLAATVTPGWQPGEAHFTGKRADESQEHKGPPSKDDALGKLEREIESRRGEQK